MRGLTALIVIGSLAATRAFAAPPHQIRAGTSFPGHAIPAVGVLGGADLVAVVELAASSSKDQFSDDTSMRYLGRQFVVTLPPDAIEISYDKKRHKLSVVTESFMESWPIARKVKEGIFSGQNGFGARAQIERRRGNIYGIEIPGDLLHKKSFSFQRELDGTEARALSKVIRLRLSGVISKAQGSYAMSNGIVSEHSHMTDATVAEPLDVWIREYGISAEITKAEWVDSRSGVVLQTDNGSN